MMGLFLDTATQIARHWHSDSKREKIKTQLDGCNLYSSLYVKSQYKSTLLLACIGLYNLLIHFEDLKRALRESHDYENADIAGIPLKQNVQKRIQQDGHWMLEYRNYEEQKLRLEDLIEDVWEDQFYLGLKSPLVDETGCVYTEGVPEMGESGAYNPIEVSCKIKTPKNCRIRKFWDNHKDQLELLGNMNINSIEAQPHDTEELKRVKKNAEKIVNGESPHGQRCTIYLSDAIICIESTHCPEQVSVHSINKKHFRPLCEVLGIECEPKD